MRLNLLQALLPLLLSGCLDEQVSTGPDAGCESAVYACGPAPVYPDPAPAFTTINGQEVAVLAAPDWARTERWMIQMRAWRDCVEVP